MRTKSCIIAVALVIGAIVAGAAAGVPSWPCAPGPSYTGNSERLEQTTIGGFPADVLLPVSYQDGAERYPVVYGLHGFGQNAHDWPELSDIIEFTAGKDVILVFPGSDRFGFWSDWRDGSLAIESDFIDRLIPEVDARYRTVPDRAHRAILGESVGAFGAMHFAARHPALFGFAGSVSGVLFTHEIFQPTMAVLIGALSARCAEPRDPAALYGSLVTDEIWWRDNNPVELAQNLGGVSLYTGHGNGMPCDSVRDLVSATGRPYAVGEVFGIPAGSQLHDALQQEAIPHVYDPLPCGTHDWPYFDTQLHHLWPQIEKMFMEGNSGPPASFDHKRATSKFTAWGWSFSADARRAPEFLDVRRASVRGVTLTGSGTETVTTAAAFAPGTIVGLTNAVEPIVAADNAGRITFHVDLAVAHQHQQYTAPARALEALGNYWTTQCVTFTPQP